MYLACSRALAALLAVVAVGGCGASISTSPTVTFGAIKQTEEAATSPSAALTARDHAGDSASIGVSVGEPQPIGEVADEAVRSCVTLLSNLGQHGGIAVPLHVSARLTSASPVDLTVQLGDVSEVGDGAQVGPPDQSVLWGVTYSDVPPECNQSYGGGSVHWPPSSGESKSWNAWLVVAGGAGDPTARDTAGRLLIRPGAQLGGDLADVSFNDPPAQNVVRCAADDPAAGGLDYLAIDPAAALEHGCSASADQQSAGGGSTPTADRICHAQYPDGTSHTVGDVTTYDREGSLSQVCAGFGTPNGLTLTGPMSCALIAAAAYGGPPGTGHAVGTLCDRASVASDFASGDWAGGAGGIACSFFSDVFATGAGLAMAGATAETGPGAEAIGVATFKALSGSLGVACAGALGGGPTGLGRRLESDHETHVAIHIVDDDKCLAINQTHGVSFAAVACPS